VIFDREFGLERSTQTLSQRLGRCRMWSLTDQGELIATDTGKKCLLGRLLQSATNLA
jgi:hypothetical protein